MNVNRNRAKNGAMEAKVLAVMIAKILCDSCGRLIVFSTCMYYIGSGNFSTLYTLLWFYSMVATLIVFYSIFNEDRIFSIGNIIGDDNSCWFKTNLIPFPKEYVWILMQALLHFQIGMFLTCLKSLWRAKVQEKRKSCTRPQ